MRDVSPCAAYWDINARLRFELPEFSMIKARLRAV
jgi:hypothetical protein